MRNFLDTEQAPIQAITAAARWYVASEIFRAFTISGSAAILAACFNNENAGRMPALPGFAKNLRSAQTGGGTKIFLPKIGGGFYNCPPMKSCLSLNRILAVSFRGLLVV